MFTVAKKYTYYGTAILITSLSCLANAEIYESETIVVTGTKTERTLLDVPVRTEIVTSKELENSHARDLAEALKNVPGVLIKPVHGKTGQEIWLQGFDADRVLVLIDGVPVTASTGSRVDLTQIAVADVDHIEIVKGAVSSLYGSEAMGGVVNIITKRTQLGSNIKATIDGGSYGNGDVRDNVFNDQHVNILMSHDSGTWFGQLVGDIRNKGGSDLDLDSWDYEGASGDKTNVALELGYRFKNGAEIALKPTYYREDVENNFSTYVPGFGDIKKVKLEKAKRKNIALNFKTPLSDSSDLQAWVMHEDFEDITNQDTLITSGIDQERIGKSEFNKGEIQLNHTVSDMHYLTLGVTAIESSLTQTQLAPNDTSIDVIDEIGGEKTRSGFEVYIQDDIFLNDEWELLPGIRYQYDSDFGSHASPKLNVMYSPLWVESDLKFRFGIGSGYRVPTLKERHYVFDHSALGYMVIGNPDLMPETSTSIQAGAEWVLNKKLRTDINLFYNDIDNLITTSLNQNKSTNELSIYEYSNIGKASTVGTDFTVAYAFTPSFQADFSYTYLYTEDKSTGFKLTRRPAHQAKVKLAYEVKSINSDFSLYGNYQSKEYLDEDNEITSPAYSTFDFKVNTQINSALKFFIGVDNLFDTTRDSSSSGQDYRPEVGRYYYLGFTISG